MLPIIITGCLIFWLMKYSYKMTKQWFFPTNVIVLFWSGIIFLYLLDEKLWHLFDLHVTTFIYVVHFLSIFLIVACCVSTIHVCKKRSNDTPVVVADASFLPDYLLRCTYLLFFILSILVFYRGLYIYHRYGFMMQKLVVIRQDFVEGKLSLPMILSFSSVIANLIALNLGLLIAYRYKWACILSFIFIGLICCNDIFIADKGNIKSFLFLLFSYIYGAQCSHRKTNKADIKLLLSLIIFVIFIFFLESVFRAESFYTVRNQALLSSLKTDSEIVYTQEKLSVKAITLPDKNMIEKQKALQKIESKLTVGAKISHAAQEWDSSTYIHFYSNIIGNFVSTGWFIEHPYPYTILGENSFNGVYSSINQLTNLLFHYSFLKKHIGPMDELYYAKISSSKNLPFNTSDYIAYLYSDFGIKGIFLFSIFFGVLLGYVFVHAQQNQSIQHVQVLALLMSGYIFCIRGMYFGCTGFWLTWALIYFQKNIPVISKKWSFPYLSNRII